MDKMDALPSNAKNISITSVRGMLYAAGGTPRDSHGQSDCCRDFYFFSLWQNKWYPLQAMTTGRFYFPLVFLDGCIYAIGGLIHSNGINAIGQKGTHPDSNLATKKVERYNLSKNRWEDVAPLPIECHRLSATVFRGNLIVYGMKRLPYRYPRYSEPHQRHLPHGQRIMITEHAVMIYQPDRNTWQDTYLGNQEHFAGWEKSELYTYKNRCYRIVFEENYSRIVSVHLLDCQSDDKGILTVTVGDVIEQNYIPPDQGAFRIGDEVFVLIGRHIYETNITISQHQSCDVDLGPWQRRDRRDRYVDIESGCGTVLTFNKKPLTNCNKYFG